MLPNQATDALAATFPAREVGAVMRLQGASGAQVFRVEVGGTPYVLRLDTIRDGFREPERQYACHRIAAEAGVAPALHHADPVAGVAIMDFITAAPVADRLGAIGRALRQLHAGPAFPPLVDYMAGMDTILAQFEAHAPLPAADVARLVAGYRELAAAYPRDGEVVASHNDLNPSNIVFDGERAWFIDFEAAFAADRYVDLAAVANFHRLEPAAEEHLLAAYGAVDRERFALMKRINRYYYGVMLLFAAAREQPGLKLDGLAGPELAELYAAGITPACLEGKIGMGLAFLRAA
jgi:aminoglycoside phosphotransferase